MARQRFRELIIIVDPKEFAVSIAYLVGQCDAPFSVI
ncbi:hypothetical protein BRAS3843_1730049 [Bradyrhizobium sp. STM 3843]|nr:hypothetical protein BRAS3843_1730049 [Bradyrhizobium sp. STM 3843]